ncbi:hypothetical protein WJX81_001368 [Elliptochloris bilobata]|uniref:Uncharacterized protein n=1 Tax=Elliptochloris bilobata TaxID=381761 RepID=A0AAW1SH00_9CHLO
MYRLLGTGDIQAGGAGGSTTYEALQKADAAWSKLRNSKAGREAGAPPEFVKTSATPLPCAPEFDAVVCGGTLGIFLACALLLKGYRVAVVERGPLRGRSQEWNISRKELAELVASGVATAEEAEECVSSEFNPVRAGFHGSPDVWTRDVLNLGVRPDRIIAKVRQRFEAKGGMVLEFASAAGVTVHPNGVALTAGSEDAGFGGAEGVLTARLLVDSTGNFGPMVQQARWGLRPDSVCLVVGACCRGFDDNTTGDVIYTNTDLNATGQYFWEAFPAGSGPSDRTTYLFTYLDADPRRPSLESLMEEYWRLMPAYQSVRLKTLQPLRILFGYFPTYRGSPLAPAWDRVLQVGDASGIQSPLSFGGFGALTRHLHRLQNAIGEALEADALDRAALGAINAYNPGLSSAWMLQRAMSVRPGRQPAPDFVNKLLGANFAAMAQRGDPVLRPFLQDVVRFGPLGATLLGQVQTQPGSIPAILAHVGVLPILDWTRHFLALGMYTALHRLARPAVAAAADRLGPSARFRLRRTLDAWEYGSGADFRL